MPVPINQDSATRVPGCSRIVTIHDKMGMGWRADAGRNKICGWTTTRSVSSEQVTAKLCSITPTYVYALSYIIYSLRKPVFYMQIEPFPSLRARTGRIHSHRTAKLTLASTQSGAYQSLVCLRGHLLSYRTCGSQNSQAGPHTCWSAGPSKSGTSNIPESRPRLE